MKSTLADLSWNSTAGKEYHWNYTGTDGIRSYSYNASNPAWNYSTEPNKSNVIDNPGDDNDGAYLFSDSSTGQPFARRGNLYNWTAATLGSGLGITSGQAADSICPRGWQLPTLTSNTSVPVTEMTNKSFSKLARTYGVKDGGVPDYNRIAEWPLQYLSTGHYDNYGYVDNRTEEGNWWSGVTTNGVNNGRSLYLWPDDVNTVAGNGHGNGLALRS